MKRLPKTLTAAVLTGALALGGTAVAQAQSPIPERVTKNGNDYIRQDDGSYRFDTRDEDDKLIQRDVISQEEALRILNAELDAEDSDNTAAPTDTDDSEIAPVNPSQDSEIEEEEGPAANGADIPAPATKEDKDGNTWYQHIQDPTIYVKDRNDVNVEITKEMREAYAKAFPGETETEKKFDAKKLAWLALPAALIIGGITWYLTHDGKTYVKDEARKNEQPTAEEKAASEQMLKENKDEVIAQGGKLAEGNSAQGTTNGAQSTDNVRGMAAETGSNSIARGAVALAIAGLLAAGAFVARRKFFA